MSLPRAGTADLAQFAGIPDAGRVRGARRCAPCPDPVETGFSPHAGRTPVPGVGSSKLGGIPQYYMYFNWPQKRGQVTAMRANWEHFSQGNSHGVMPSAFGGNCGDLNTAPGTQETCLHRLRGRVRVHACSVTATNLGTARLYSHSQNLGAPRAHLGDRGNHDQPGAEALQFLLSTLCR